MPSIIDNKTLVPEREEYTYTKYDPLNELTGDKAIIDAYNKMTNASTAYDTHINTGFTYDNEQAYQDAMKAYLNRGKFSYDINGDALYQQYKDKYIQQGKMAMADTMGQAAAMTGGYGNSYAASVGNQAYQSSLQNLNDVSLQLYQMAYDRYAQEGQDLYNKYGMYSNDRATKYGEWMDKGTILNNNRTYASTVYNDMYNRGYTEHATSESLKQADVADANSYAQWLADFNEGVRQFDKTIAFNEEQANKPTVVAPSYLTDLEEIDAWSTRISDAKTEKEALMWVEQLEKLDPSLADKLYEEWVWAHGKDPREVDTTVKANYNLGGGGGGGRYAIHTKD